MNSDERSRLLWRCRRGARELDSLLAPFTEQHYEFMSRRQRVALGRLLERQDTEILDWLFEREKADEPEIGELINAILEFSAQRKIATRKNPSV